MKEMIVIRFQLIHNGKVIRNFNVDIPERVPSIESDSEYFRALEFYNKLQKVMKGHAVPRPPLESARTAEEEQEQT